MPLVGGCRCLELVLYGIRVLAEQHCEPMMAKHRQSSSNKSEEALMLAWRASCWLLSALSPSQCRPTRGSHPSPPLPASPADTSILPPAPSRAGQASRPHQHQNIRPSDIYRNTIIIIPTSYIITTTTGTNCLVSPADMKYYESLTTVQTFLCLNKTRGPQ